MSALQNNQFLLASGSPTDPTFPVQRSVRLRSSASAYFNRTFGTPTNASKWTKSFWVKRGTLGSVPIIAAQTVSAAANYAIQFNADNTLTWQFSNTLFLTTTQVFRDPSAWYHIVMVWDSANATAANRAILYVNGVQVTAFVTDNRASVSASQNAWETAGTGYISYNNGTNSFDGYLTEVNFIDGQALTPSSFGGYNSGTGVWEPRKYTGTYGTNGFYLNFQDNSAATAAAIGKDSSGNGNNWTPNNISVTAGVTYDSMTDVPTLTSPTTSNFCVGNPLNSDGSTWTNANLNFSLPNSTNNAQGTMAATSGKFYWEVVYTSGAQGTGVQEIGLRTRYTNGIIYAPDGSKYINGTNSAYGAAYTTGDVIGVALDMTGGTVTFYKNNASQGAISISGSGMVNATFSLSAGGGVTSVGYVNFGQRPFTYTPPTGFVALNTYNLPTPTIKNGANQFAATLYTGNGATQSIVNTVNNVSFQPDMVWIKNRSAAYTHTLYDSIRGSGQYLQSNTTDIESNGGSAFLTSFNSNGFNIGSQVTVNNSGNGLVGWQWKASNATAVTNTAGSITSSVSANPTAGFSIVTYTGTGANATVGHGLGIAPKMIIVKRRNSTSNWPVLHTSISGSPDNFLYLNSTSAVINAGVVFNGTTPTSTIFGVGTDASVNASGGTYVTYCFAEIAGYSKAFSYTGNGSTDGTFVYCGFRPRWVMIKRTDTTGDWVIWDTSRNTYNAAQNGLYPNLSASEGNSYFIDILSNGFKLRMSTIMNVNAGNYIGFAVAENPFSYSLAR